MSHQPNDVGFQFAASWAGIHIEVTNSSITHGRALVTHTFPRRDGADLEDMGREPRVISLDFLFIDHRFTSEGNWRDRFLAFEQAVQDGKASALIHPYVGAMGARVSNFTHTANADTDKVIRASATFTEEFPLPPVFPVGAGSQTRVSENEVALDVDAAQTELDSEGLESNVLGDVGTAMTGWATDINRSARSVQLEMASLNNRLSTELDSYEVLTDLDRHPLNKTYTRLQHTLRRAAEAFTTTTTRIVEIQVTEAAPLRIIAAKFYNAVEADRRFAEMLELNPDIRNPSNIEAGTTLKAYSRGVAPARNVQ